jgi:phosphatidate phosphatase APP1
MFEEVLDKFLEENPLPKNKAALKEWVLSMFKTYKSAQAKKSVSSRNLTPDEAKRMSEIGLSKRWGSKSVRKDLSN